MEKVGYLDYWVEIPAGEFLFGVSDEQRTFLLGTILRGEANYSWKDHATKRQINSAIEKLITSQEVSQDEAALFGLPADKIVSWCRYTTEDIPKLHSVQTDHFYISRFPFTRSDHTLLEHGQPSSLEELRTSAYLCSREEALRICSKLSCRLPTEIEWEKAGRGLDGRLYPWGNNWIESYGWFYGNQTGSKAEVNAYPNAVSPYGLWAMVGNYPNYVFSPNEVHGTHIFRGEKVSIVQKGTYAKEIDSDDAPYYAALPVGFGGERATFRLAADNLPRKYWQGTAPNL